MVWDNFNISVPFFCLTSDGQQIKDKEKEDHEADQNAATKDKSPQCPHVLVCHPSSFVNGSSKGHHFRVQVGFFRRVESQIDLDDHFKRYDSQY